GGGTWGTWGGEEKKKTKPNSLFLFSSPASISPSSLLPAFPLYLSAFLCLVLPPLSPPSASRFHLSPDLTRTTFPVEDSKIDIGDFFKGDLPKKFLMLLGLLALSRVGIYIPLWGVDISAFQEQLGEGSFLATLDTLSGAGLDGWDCFFYLPANVALIAFFNYFYTFLQLDPADVSDQLKRQGASVPNTRPGKATAALITKVLTRISVLGSAFLGTMAAAPALVEGITHLTAFRGFAGTSILILVGCATDTARKVQAELVSQKYRTIELDDISAGGGGIPPPRWILGTTGSSVAAPTRRRSTRRDGAHRAHQVAPRALLAARTAPASMLHAEQVSAPFPPFPMPFRLAHACPPFPCLSALPMHFRLPHAFPPSPCLSALRMPFRLAHAFPPCACLSAFPMHSRLAHAFPPLLMPFSLPMPFPLCSCRSPCPCLSPSAHALPPLPMLCPVCSCRPFRHVREMAGEGVATSIELTNCRPRHGIEARGRDGGGDLGDLGGRGKKKKTKPNSLFLFSSPASISPSSLLPAFPLYLSAFLCLVLPPLSPPSASRFHLSPDLTRTTFPVEDSKIDIGDFFKGDLPKKFLMLLGLLALSRVGIYIPLWGVDISAFQEQLGEGSFLATLDTLSGGGIGRLGLFSLGIVPYINAQIVFQLLGTLYPKIGDLQKKEGEAGRKKAQQYMKYMAVAFGALQEAERRFFYLPANVALIAFFNYFYTFLQLDPADVSDQLKRQGASVPNTRPGKATAALITKVLTRISVLGSAFLGTMAAAPALVEGITHLTAFRGFAGTSILILVGCATDTARKVQAELVSQKYRTIELDDISAGGGGIPPPRWILGTTGSSVAAPTRRRSTRRDGAHRAHQVAPRALLAARTAPASMLHAEQVSAPFPPFPMPFRLAHACPPFPCLSALPMHFRLPHAFPPSPCLSALRMPFRLAHAFPPCACLSAFPMHSRLAHAFPPLLMPFSLPMPFPLCSCRSPCPCLSPSAHALPPLPMLCPVCSCRPFRHVREMAGEGVATSIELTNCRPRHGGGGLGGLGGAREKKKTKPNSLFLFSSPASISPSSLLPAFPLYLSAFLCLVLPPLSPPSASRFHLSPDLTRTTFPVEDSKIDIGDFFKGDLPKKFLMLLGLLALSRVGIYIPLWGVDISAFQEQLGEGSFLATLDTLSGGGIGRLGLFSLGIVPYINAQIVFQLLGTLYPKIGDLQKKEGEAGRKKAQQYMKYMAVAFGALQEAERRFFYLPANVALIAFFNYFYTFLQLDPADVSDQLKRQGASVPNTRPGKATAALITKVLTRISVLGSAFLGTMAAAPALVEGITHLTAFRGFAGTSILILVGCATDTARKVQAELVSQKYRTIELDDISAGGGGIPPPRWILGTTGSSVAAPTRRRSTRRDGAHRAHQVAPRALLAARTAPASMLHAEQVSAPFPPFPMPFRLAHACPPFPCLSALPMHFRLPHAFPPSPCLSALRMPFRLAHAFPPCACLSAFPMHSRLAHAFPPLLMPFSLPMPFPLCSCRSPCPCLSPSAHALPPLPMLCPVCSCRPFRHVREMAGEGVATSIELTNCRPRHGGGGLGGLGGAREKKKTKPNSLFLFSSPASISPSSLLPAFPLYLSAFLCLVLPPLSPPSASRFHLSPDLTRTTFPVEDSKIDIGDFFKGDLPKKFLMLLGLLALSRVGIYIPLWGVDISAFQEQLGEGSFLATLDTLSGGGIGRLGLFSLGIVPYINAQIVFQLLGTLYPKIGDLQKKEGEAGRKKAQQYMKYMAVAFGALQEAERRFFYLPANVALIAFFNYFYTFLQLDPADVSDQLKRQGASVPNTRPGKATAALITKVLTRISVLGSAFLGTMAAAPALVEGITHLTAFRGFAGTSILILVGCATDTARKVQAELVSQKYRTIELDDISAGGGGIPPPRWILGTTGSSVAAPTRRRSTRRDGAHRAHQVAPRALLAARTAPASMLHAEQVSAPFPPFPMPFRLAHACPPFPCLSALPMHFRLPHAFPPSPCLSALRMPFRLAHAFPPCACLSAFPMHSRLAHAFPPLLMPFSLPMPFPLCSCRSPCPCLSPSAHALPPLPMLCPVCSCRPFRHVREMAGEGVATSIELTNCRPRHGIEARGRDGGGDLGDLGGRGKKKKTKPNSLFLFSSPASISPSSLLPAFPLYLSAFLCLVLPPLSPPSASRFHLSPDLTRTTFPVEDSKIDIGDFFKGDLPKKFLMLLGLLALSRVGIYIPLWGVDISAFQEQLGEGSFLATLDTLSGGGIGRLGLFSLGIVPYINAQIVFQLLGTLYPKIGDLQKKEGEAGRKKAQQYMKYMAVAFGALQEAERRFFYLPANVALIAFFNYFYTFLQLDPADVSDQLKRQGASVPNTRPGKATAALITKVLTRISVLGSAFLGTMAAAPALVEGITHLTAFRGFAGTSILILVGCATDTARKVQAELVSQKYRTIELDDISAGGGGIPPPRWILGTTGSSVAAPTRRRSTRRDGAHRAHQVAPRALLAARTAPASMLHAEQVSAPFPPFPMPFRLAHACPPFPCLSALPMHFRLPHAFPPSPCLSALRMPFRLAHAFPPCACLSAFPMHSRLAHAFPPLLMPFSLPMPFPLCSCRSPCPCLSPSAHALPPLPMLCPVCSCRPFRHVREMAGEGVATSIELTNCRPRHGGGGLGGLGGAREKKKTKPNSLFLFSSPASISPSSLLPAFPLYLSAFLCLVLPPLSPPSASRFHLSPDLTRTTFPVEDSKIDIGDFFKGDLPKKFLMLLGLLALSRVGIYIPLWGVDISAFQEQLGEGSFLATLDTLSGGGIGRLGLFSLGIVPYINAQIVFQLLGTLYPKIGDLQKKEGEAGRKKAQQYMKYMAVAFGALQEAERRFFYLPANVALIAFFNYFYTFLQLDPADVSDQLKRQGASVPNTRPGKATAALITKVLTRISVLGSAFLGTMAAAPALVEGITHLTAFRGFAGTSILILVGCATDTARKVQAELVSQKYRTIELDDISAGGGGIPPPRWILGTTGSSVAAPTRRRSTRRDGAHRAHQVAPRALLAARTAPASMLHAEQVSAPFPPFPMPFRLAHACPPFPAFPPCPCISAFPMPFRLPHAFPPCACLSALRMPFRLAHAFPPFPCIPALRMPFPLCSCRSPCPCLSPSAHAVLPAHAFPPLLMRCPLCPCFAPFARAVRSAMSGRWRGRESPPPSSSPTAGHDMVPLRIAGGGGLGGLGGAREKKKTKPNSLFLFSSPASISPSSLLPAFPLYLSAFLCLVLPPLSPPSASRFHLSPDLTRTTFPVEDSKIDIGDFFKGDLPKKFLMLLGLLALSRVGIYIPLWGVDISAFQEQLGEGSFLATLDTLSGGGIGRLGLFSLGIVPYINAQIVFQLLGTLYPKIGDLQKKEGEAGRKKAQQYMKYMAVAFGALQVLTRISVLGSAFLGTMAAAPALVEGITHLTAFRGFAGTSILILVGCATDTARKVQAELVSQKYRTIELDDISAGGGGIPPPRRRIPPALWEGPYFLPPAGTTGSSVAAPTRRRSTRRDGAHRAHQVAPRALLAARTAPASMLHAEQVSAPFPPFPMPFRLAHACPPFPCLSALPMHFRRFPMPFRLPHAFPPCACLSALRMPFRLAHAFPPFPCIPALRMPFPLCSCRSPCPCLSPSAHAVLPAHAFPPLLMRCPLCPCFAPFARAVRSAMSGRWRGRESPPPSSSPTAGHDMVPLRIAGPADVATSADVACSLDRRLAMPP
ncbi:unnamed protein product, partial [Closterium sp. Naga37s-1]